MFGNHRKTIGVFITQIYQEYQTELSKGISERARELGYNVAYLTNFLGYGEPLYEEGEFEIADLPNYDNLDGIIITPDTMAPSFKDHLLNRLKDKCKCPVVSVRQRVSDYYNVLIDDASLMIELMRHFIVDHGFKRINFLTGPMDNPVSLQRLSNYRDMMKEYNIPYDEEQIYFGDFWKIKAYDAVNLWLSDPDKKPEAIVCANDYMAITVYSALTERGISVPGEIAVSGCDNIYMAQDFHPALTTIHLPYYEMGVWAVDKIHKHIKGVSQERDTLLKTVTKIRESCGCEREDGAAIYQSNKLFEELENKEYAVANIGFMSVELTSIKTVDQLHRKLPSFLYMIKDYASFYLCLNKNWDIYDGDGMTKELNNNKDMVMAVGINKGEWLQMIEFKKPALLPKEAIQDSPQIFMFNMLHYQDRVFGYTAINFYNNEVYQQAYQGWLINVSNTLENMQINNELNRLVYKLEDMYIKDELTDLYNRRALTTLGQKYLELCVAEQQYFMIFSADLDKLKMINDNYGHSNGDYAIRLVADALKHAAKDDEICMRVGGDEFVAIGLDYNHDKMHRFLKTFEDYIDRSNRETDRAFKVEVSYGWSIIKPNKFVSLEDCLIVVDSKMYRQKHEKRKITE